MKRLGSTNQIMRESIEMKGRWYVFNKENREVWCGCPDKESALRECEAGFDEPIFISNEMAELIGKVDEAKSAVHTVYHD